MSVDCQSLHHVARDVSTVITTTRRHGSMGTGRARPAGAGGDRALRRARLRADDRRRHRRARRASPSAPSSATSPTSARCCSTARPDAAGHARRGDRGGARRGSAPRGRRATRSRPSGGCSTSRASTPCGAPRWSPRNPSLQERELLKMATLATAAAAALRERGTPAATATVAAEAGVTAFRIGFEAGCRAPQTATWPPGSTRFSTSCARWPPAPDARAREAGTRTRAIAGLRARRYAPRHRQTRTRLGVTWLRSARR